MSTETWNGHILVSLPSFGSDDSSKDWGFLDNREIRQAYLLTWLSVKHNFEYWFESTSCRLSYPTASKQAMYPCHIALDSSFLCVLYLSLLYPCCVWASYLAAWWKIKTTAGCNLLFMIGTRSVKNQSMITRGKGEWELLFARIDIYKWNSSLPCRRNTVIFLVQ